ncbi:MAG: META domain-containing protein [Rubrivivax sp.]|nr:META domain-containing protein [Rubrivivax sp.]
MITPLIPKRAAPALAGLALVACATPEPPAPSLSGSRWVLVAIESMDEAQPTARPDDASRYRLAFGAQGQASLQLDCNRGSGTWQATPSAQAEPGRASGSLVFGPIATTRAMCPPGSLAPRLERALPYVRSYLLKDGQLHLSLMADGGILSWRPAP